jgi:transcriptional regulator with XRE-family HTH domain
MAGYEALGSRDRGTEQSEVRHLTQAQLAERLGVSQRTLEGWRYRGKGPAYLRLEGRIAYRLTDVERFELECLQTTSLVDDP